MEHAPSLGNLVDPWKQGGSSTSPPPSSSLTTRQSELSPTSPLSSMPTADELSLLSMDEVYEKLKPLLVPLASSNQSEDVSRLIDLFDRFYASPKAMGRNNIRDTLKREFLDTKDDAGSAALIYASCFGYKQMCFILLSAGASVNIQDKHGWTPLVWASQNAHDEVVRLLIEAGASSSAALKTGMSVGDFITHSTLDLNPDSRLANALEMSGLRTSSESRSSQRSDQAANSKPVNEYYRSAFDFHGIDEELYQTVGFGLGSGLTSHFLSPKHDDDDDIAPCEEGTDQFDWDQCLPDQMFVFDHRQIESILNATVKRLRLPHGTRSSIATKLAPANVIFLCVRYGHNYGGGDLLQSLLKSFCHEVNQSVSNNPHDMSLQAFWLANLSQLLYYMKRDAALVTATGSWQIALSELIQEIYQLLVGNARDRLSKVIINALCDYESIPGGESIVFEKRKLKKRFSRRSSKDYKDNNSTVTPVPEGNRTGLFGSMFSRFMRTDPSSPSTSTSSLGKQIPFLATIQANMRSRPPVPHTVSPRTITTVLSSTLFVMQCYQVHPSFQIQAVRQLFYFAGSMLFNSFLKEPKYCCRWKGIQIRMNLSALEEWIRNHCARESIMTIFMEIGRKQKEEASASGTPAGSPTQRSNSTIYMQSNLPQSSSSIASSRFTLSGGNRFDDLIIPLPLSHPELFLKWLDPVMLVCQLLQITTTSFSEPQAATIPSPSTSSPIANKRSLTDTTVMNKDDDAVLNAFVDTLATFATTTLARYRNIGDSLPPTPGPDSIDDMPSLESKLESVERIAGITPEQLYHLLVLNYTYEKGEMNLASRVIRFLEDRMEQRKGKSKVQTESKESSASAAKPQDLLTGDDPPPDALNTHPPMVPEGSNESIHTDKIPPLYLKDQAWLPFQLQLFHPIRGSSGSAPEPEATWSDSTNIKKEESKSTEEKWWWERRVRIEVPDFILKQIGQ